MDEQIEFLEEAGRIITDALQDEIIQEGLMKSGELARSPRYNVELVNGNPELKVYIQDYGFYQDSGVSGLQTKVTKSSESFNPPGQFKSKVIGGPLPFPVKYVIARDGFRPRPFINEAYARGIRWIDENIGEFNTDLINRDVEMIFSQNGATVN